LQLEPLNDAVEQNDTDKLYRALEQLVSGYVPSKEIKQLQGTVP
jgi:hypothetical protein